MVEPGEYAEFEWESQDFNGLTSLTLVPQGAVNICGADLCEVSTPGRRHSGLVAVGMLWRSHATTNASSCASCDPEGDGFTNLEKFQYGMNPLVMYSLTVPVQVNSYSSGNSASVTELGDTATYTWSIDDGTVATGQGTPAITGWP